MYTIGHWLVMFSLEESWSISLSQTFSPLRNFHNLLLVFLWKRSKYISFLITVDLGVHSGGYFKSGNKHHYLHVIMCSCIFTQWADFLCWFYCLFHVLSLLSLSVIFLVLAISNARRRNDRDLFRRKSYEVMHTLFVSLSLGDIWFSSGVLHRCLSMGLSL